MGIRAELTERDRWEEKIQKAWYKFRIAINRARARLMGRCLNIINEAVFHGNWRAAVWIFERCFPHYCGRRRATPAKMNDYSGLN